MPLYVYSCTVCGHTDELLLSMLDDVSSDRVCPACPLVAHTAPELEPKTFQRVYTPFSTGPGTSGLTPPRTTGRIIGGDSPAVWGKRPPITHS